MSALQSRTRWKWIVVAVFVGMAAALVPHVPWRGSPPPASRLSLAPAVGMPGAPPTSAAGLRQRIGDMETRLTNQPDDIGAAILLADALLRHTRATNDTRAAARAAEILGQALRGNPGQYDALRLLGAAHLSLHRFRDALDIARRARNQRPDDAWNYGVIGDAFIELGDYEEAFAAFDTMMTLRPSAAAYARVAYARELQGDLEGALQAMQMAVDATSAHDPEARAWHTAQVGQLLFSLGRVGEADREFRRAAFDYPDYPHALVGQGTVKAARGDRDGALRIYLDQFRRTPDPDLAARIGDLHALKGEPIEAERYYQLVEELAGPIAAQSEATLALFLAEHDRKLPVALQIAEAVAAVRHDIFTEDTLAWVYYKMGRLDEAGPASERALRTGSRNPRLLAHAAEIRAAALRHSQPEDGEILEDANHLLCRHLSLLSPNVGG